MKKGFTLIELLIVTVVIVTLMGIVFRLAGTGSDQKARAITIDRMQRLENALSGYYAAFGSYPPVPLQGRSRDIFTAVADNGVQRTDETGSKNLEDAFTSFSDSGNESKSKRMCAQIEAACRAQPVAVLYPLNEKKWQGSISELAGGEGSLLKNFGNSKFNSDDWKECELFQFGLLSFLLPRYTFMLEGDETLYDRYDNGRPIGQWNANNRLPCLLNGERVERWRDMQDYLGAGERWTESGSGSTSSEHASMISNIASQAVCARWMPNFKGIIHGGLVFFGVNTHDSQGGEYLLGNSSVPNPNFPSLPLFSAQGGTGSASGGDRHLLDGMTVRDGWGHDFYYYSPPPYQSYRLWSAGPNGKTYPPWLDLPTGGQALKIINRCIEDDVVHLSN